MIKINVKLQYSFGKISKAGYRHFSILHFSNGKDGFLISVLGVILIVKFFKKNKI